MLCATALLCDSSHSCNSQPLLRWASNREVKRILIYKCRMIRCHILRVTRVIDDGFHCTRAIKKGSLLHPLNNFLNTCDWLTDVSSAYHLVWCFLPVRELRVEIAWDLTTNVTGNGTEIDSNFMQEIWRVDQNDNIIDLGCTNLAFNSANVIISVFSGLQPSFKSAPLNTMA